MKSKSSKETKITKLQLTVAGQVIDLTLEQARELKGVLEELFKTEKQIEYVPYPTTPAPISPQYPIWVESPDTSRPFWKDWETICVASCADGHSILNCSLKS